MKVLHLTDAPDLVGGVQTYLAELCQALPPAGVDCEVWHPLRSDDGLATHLSRWADYGYERELASRIERYRPAIVHAHNLWMRLSPLPLRAAKRAGVPVVMTVHDYHLVCPRKWMIDADDRPCDAGFGARCLHSDCRGSKEGWAWLPYNSGRWLKTAVHRRMLRAWVDVFLCPSLHLGIWMRQSLGVESVLHLPNFARPPILAPVPSGDPRRLLFAGRLSREKGVEILLRAMPAILGEHPQASLVVAGDGPERTSLERLASALGIENAVEFTGSVGGDELDERYRQAGICLLPTLWMENCPVAVLEAMAYGRAVVATRIGGVPELVRDGTTGVLVERGNYGDLARTVISLLNDPGRVLAMGRRAAADFEKTYTAKIHVDRLVTIYRALIRGSDPASCSAAS